MFWIVCTFISCAKGALSNKLHIKEFIVFILFFNTFIHFGCLVFGNAYEVTNVITGSVPENIKNT